MKMRILALGALIFSTVLVLAGCGSTANASGSNNTTKQPQDVTITVTDFKIVSSLTTFHVGVPYHFIVTNKGQTVHEVMTGPVAKANAPEDERDAASLFEVSEIPVGDTKTGDFTFTTTAADGVLEFSCHQTGHYEMGMRLAITVIQ